MSHDENGERRHGKWSRWSTAARIRFVAAAIMLVPALFALFATVTMWLWNWLMPELFHLPAISFWQAVGILILSRILFSRGGGGMGRRRWKRAYIRDRMAE